MWYVFMDEILSSLNSRFSDELMKLGLSVHHFSDFNGIWDESLYSSFLCQYQTLKDKEGTILAERRLWVAHMEDMEIKKKDEIVDDEEEEEYRSMSTNLSKNLKYMYDQKLHLEMPNLYEAFVVAGTIPF